MNKDLEALTVMLAMHHRKTDSGDCTCGHVGLLGRYFTEHMAQEIMASGWRPVVSAAKS